MKYSLLILLAMASVARGQSNYIPAEITGKYTISVSPDVIFGDCVTISPKGKVTIKDGVTLDEASLAFWRGLAILCPQFRVTKQIADLETIIKKLDAIEQKIADLERKIEAIKAPAPEKIIIDRFPYYDLEYDVGYIKNLSRTNLFNNTTGVK